MAEEHEREVARTAAAEQGMPPEVLKLILSFTAEDRRQHATAEPDGSPKRRREDKPSAPSAH